MEQDKPSQYCLISRVDTLKNSIEGEYVHTPSKNVNTWAGTALTRTRVLDSAGSSRERIMEPLNSTMRMIPLTTDDIRLLSYVQHMAQTARSPAAREMFVEYLSLERQHLAANNGLHSPVRLEFQTPVVAN